MNSSMLNFKEMAAYSQMMLLDGQQIEMYSGHECINE